MSKSGQEHAAIAVSTPEGASQILQAGGSQPWALDLRRAKLCQYLVCVQNRDRTGEGQRAAHNTAFLIGQISDFVQSTTEPNRKPQRWLITLKAYATVEIADAWTGSRNPVNYTSLEEIGVDLAGLQFLQMPAVIAKPPVELPLSMSIDEAKRAVAARYDVRPDQVEITIRG